VHYGKNPRNEKRDFSGIQFFGEYPPISPAQSGKAKKIIRPAVANGGVYPRRVFIERK
jgi:hypothetical protein